LRADGGWVSAATGTLGFQCVAPVPACGEDAVRRMPRSRSPAHLFIGTEWWLDWAGCVRAAIPAFLRPSPLNFIYRSLSAEAPTNIHRAAFTFLDFDPY
jgi:hypothetical protein